MNASGKLKNISKSKTKLDRPFKKTVWQQAQNAVEDYQIVIQRGGDLGYIGTSIEMPTVLAEGKTPDKCLKATQEALIITASTMIECGKMPLQGSILAKRNIQVNVRLTPKEKLLLKSASSSRGFNGLSDFIRTSVFEHIRCLTSINLKK